MMKRIRFVCQSLLTTLFLSPLIGYAATDHLFGSAKRMEGESFEEALSRFKEKLPPESFGKLNIDSAYEVAKDIDSLDFGNIPTWKSTDLRARFDGIRDLRYLQPSKGSIGNRRISWLYPDDGCFYRAALVGKKFEEWEIDRPMKIFIFGNLNVKTKNHPSGAVSWWYHVVPIVKVDGIPMVLDPAIDPKSPLELKAWALTQTDDLHAVSFSICHQYTTFPNSPCIQSSKSDESGALSGIQQYLQLEKTRIGQLNRNVEDELGNFPPW